ncbi:MAG TPA: ABC transporter permease, partial [Syntrophales bacterium]|nr:ABC transporter permease [Syntrophales bacterium]
MLNYILRRLIFMVPLLIGITIICFAVIHIAPGSPTDLQTQMNPRASAEVKERLRALYELDKPLHEQYLSWLKKLVVLDLGNSFSPDGRPVADKILERIPITIIINALSLGLIIVVALPVGVASAVRRNSLFDKITTVLVFIGFAMPTFWLALLLMILFGIHLGWLPISGIRSLNYEYLPPFSAFADLVKHLILPVFLSAFGGIAGFSRYIRANMLEVIRQDYITTA